MDDLVIFMSKGSPLLSEIREALSKEFEMKDLGEVKNFLSMEITRDQTKHMITLLQKGYIKNILEQFGYLDAKPCWMLMVNNLTKCKDDYKGYNL